MPASLAGGDAPEEGRSGDPGRAPPSISDHWREWEATRAANARSPAERSDLTSPGVGGYSPVYGQTISWRNAEFAAAMDNNPRTVFERMFGEGSTAEKRLAQLPVESQILRHHPRRNLPAFSARSVRTIAIALTKYVYSGRERTPHSKWPRRRAASGTSTSESAEWRAGGWQSTAS